MNRKKENDLKDAWSDFVEFMKCKYGEPFEWTCPHLKRIDDILNEPPKKSLLSRIWKWLDTE